MAYTREIDDFILIQYIILFTLAKANRHVTHTQLSGLILENLNVDFAAYQSALRNLEELGYLHRFSPDERTTIYELLPEGKQANSFFEKNIPIYIREPIEEAIPPFFHEEARKRSIRSELVPLNPREYGAELGIYDGETPLLKLFVYVGERADANDMLRRLREHPEEIYHKVLDVLYEKQED